MILTEDIFLCEDTSPNTSFNVLLGQIKFGFCFLRFRFFNQCKSFMNFYGIAYCCTFTVMPPVWSVN